MNKKIIMIIVISFLLPLVNLSADQESSTGKQAEEVKKTEKEEKIKQYNLRTYMDEREERKKAEAEKERLEKEAKLLKDNKQKKEKTNKGTLDPNKKVRTDKKKENKPKRKKKLYTIDELKKAMYKNNKNISMQELENRLKKLESYNSRRQKNDLADKIDDLKSNARDLRSKSNDIDEAIENNNKLADNDPHKIPPQQIAELKAKQAEINKGKNKIDDNLDEMEKNYIMLDFKHMTNELHVDYNRESLESFKESQYLNLKIKILDILEANYNKLIKENELSFMKSNYKMQEKSFELGYTDENTLKEFKKKIEAGVKDLESIEDQINYKLDELEIICGIDVIDGFKIDKKFFKTKLKSDDPNYYKDKYENHSYQFDLLSDSVDEMDRTSRRLRDVSNAHLESDIMETNSQKTALQKSIILENVKIGAINLLSGYNKLTAEKEKHQLKMDSSEDKVKNNQLRFKLGHISKLDFNTSEFEYSQLEYASEIIDLKLLRIKILLDAMANGIVNK